jgi:hypothetical protein
MRYHIYPTKDSKYTVYIDTSDDLSQVNSIFDLSKNLKVTLEILTPAGKFVAKEAGPDFVSVVKLMGTPQ